MPAAAGSVREALEAATDALVAAGCESPRLDAELLLAEAIDGDRARLAAEPEMAVDATQARRFGEMVRRRVTREPVAYILGRKGFRHLDVHVDRRALIPRPETELLVELALELRPDVVIDVGTGSGAVALAIAHELTEASVVGTDVSQATLDLARDNARALELDGRARFLEGSLPPGANADLLVANLPYVAEADWAGLQPEITKWEPRGALIAGPTGLEAIDRLLGDVALHEGRIAAIGLEVGEGQAEAVTELVRRAGFERTETRRDLAGLERVVVGLP
jgi:release factor glutamine methyltransferase